MYWKFGNILYIVFLLLAKHTKEVGLFHFMTLCLLLHTWGTVTKEKLKMW